MKILTFTGKTPSEALKKAKMEIGDEGMLIETKEIHKKALGREALYEIVIGIDEDMIPATYKKINKPLSKQQPLKNESQDVLYDISNAARQISEISKVVDDPLQEYMEPTRRKDFSSNAVLEPKELKEIKTEINKLTDKVKIIQNMFWDEKAPSLENKIPSEFSEIYRLASQSGMNPEHLDMLMQITLEHMPLKMRENSATVKRYFQTILRKMVPIRREATPTVGSKKVIISMLHTAKGNPKILKQCTLPLTGKGVVDMIITEMGVFEFINNELVLIELMQGVTLNDIKEVTPASYKIASNLIK